MTTPKILPWLAHSAGVSEFRAEALWRTACLRAALITGEQDTSHYWGVAKQQLLFLLASERRRSQALACCWLPILAALNRWSALANSYGAALDAVISGWHRGASGSRQEGRGSGSARRESAGPRALLPHFASLTPPGGKP